MIVTAIDSAATSPKFLEVVQPEYVVVSAGEGNKFSHPHQEVLDVVGEYSGAKVESTKNGAVVFLSNGTDIWLL